MSATGNTRRNVELNSLTVEEQRAIEGGGLFSGIADAIKGLIPPTSAASSVVKKDNDTQSGIIGKI